mgnify:CR=1 FL=1
MEQIGFIGANDKKDLLLNVAKIISKLNKSVLIVDATLMQRLRYIVPKVSSTPTYVSEYDGVDVAVGFLNLMQISNYLSTPSLNYDYIIIDTDNPQTFNSFMIPNSKITFFSTSYDEFELQKSLEILSTLRAKINLTKLIISSDINNKHDEYLNHLLENYPVSWSSERVEFPDTDSDRNATLANQLIKQISVKNYSSIYKDSLEYLVSLILEGIVAQNDIKRIIRKK